LQVLQLPEQLWQLDQHHVQLVLPIAQQTVHHNQHLQLIAQQELHVQAKATEPVKQQVLQETELVKPALPTDLLIDRITTEVITQIADIIMADTDTVMVDIGVDMVVGDIATFY
jgi:hypothetical protein